VTKKHPIGFIADKPNFMSMEDQHAKLIEYGIEAAHIYNPTHGIEAAIGSCGPGDELVLYSARALGVQADLKAAVKRLAKVNCDLVILRGKKPIRVNTVDSLPYTMAVEDINMRNTSLGAVNGRRKLITEAVADKIIHFVRVQGNRQEDAAKEYGTSTRAVSDIMNGRYFTKGRASQ